jgi:hypothetical protein
MLTSARPRVCQCPFNKLILKSLSEIRFAVQTVEENCCMFWYLFGVQKNMGLPLPLLDLQNRLHDDKEQGQPFKCVQKINLNEVILYQRS